MIKGMPALIPHFPEQAFPLIMGASIKAIRYSFSLEKVLWRPSFCPGLKPASLVGRRFIIVRKSERSPNHLVLAQAF